MSELVEQARGRARFCRDRGEVKTPDLLTAAADRIEQLEREQGWQDIATAPKDGTRFLATDGVNVTVVEWKVYSGRWEKLTGWNHLYGARWNGPVAWRHLPAAAIRNRGGNDGEGVGLL